MGGGSSSLYWSARAKEVTTIESDKEWFDTIKSQMKPNNHLHLKTAINTNPNDDYAKFPLTLNKKFDIAIIDGGGIFGKDTRMLCAKVVLDILNTQSKDGVMVILDNADWYNGIAKFLRENDFIQIDFSGFGAINCYTWTTSIFLSRNFAFKPLDRQPNYSISAIHHDII
ncbi:hypothetical protein [Helicobacter sp. MIT 99-5507]|uniref:hypothetical protein n=1 Tax=Helicobacter sp. MIT 99-5507 TaxID=152489 RepID=UPI0011C04DAB|nr:hypothetical protein [Helicobacter sp. MIT 99-5507]